MEPDEKGVRTILQLRTDISSGLARPIEASGDAARPRKTVLTPFYPTIDGLPGSFPGTLIVIPEPGTVIMLLTGGLGLLLVAIRR